MFRYTCCTVPLGVALLAALAPAQQKVDFTKEIQPLLRQNCVGCHGPAVQQGGLRLDRKSSAMKPFSRRITAGNSANSMVYHRVSGDDFGPQMPPTGPLRPDEIALIKTWIDQGADWPDALANELELPPLNPKAVSMVDMLHNDDQASFMKLATSDPSLLNARGPEGSTPFMYAVLYSNAATLAKLLKLGADPNKLNDAKATALMWAARDLEKTRLLVAHGADVNARSDDRRTPLMIASRRFGGAPIAKYLLDKGANPNPNAKADCEGSPLLEALTAGDPEIVAMLLQHGADVKSTGDQSLNLAVTMGCEKCFDLLVPKITDKSIFTLALQDVAVYGNVRAIRVMLDHGADVNAYDPLGRTPLMYATVSDVLPLDAIKLLIERGADVNAKDRHKNSGDTGVTILDLAKRNGNPAIIELLEKSGAKTTPEVQVALKPRQGNSIRSAVQDSLPLLQRSDSNFVAKAGCVSCHNNSMTAMTVAVARSHGLQVDEQTAAAQVRSSVQILEKNRDLFHQGFTFPVGDMFGDFVWSYVLLGLDAENHKPDLNTDAAALLVLSRQRPNGEWAYPHADIRPPVCLDYMTQTALSLRALQKYAPKSSRVAAEKAIRTAASWLAKAPASNNEDRTWRVLGLAWADTEKPAMQAAMKELVAAQRPDGGWAELPSMATTAFATGESLVALHTAGMPVTDPVYQRGVKFLLDTQQEDGSWYVKTRALAFQPAFESGFPHAHDQWISAAGTNWAAMALTYALPEAGKLTASSRP